MSQKLSGKEAFDFAYENYLDLVLRVAGHYTDNISDAEDAVQDVFLKLWKSGKSFKDNEHLKAWLCRVTINGCHDIFRASRRLTVLDDNIPSTDTLPDDDIMDCIRALPENYRNVIFLHYYEGYTAKEIGEILGKKTNTVLSWLSRGRALLKDALGGDFGE